MTPKLSVALLAAGCLTVTGCAKKGEVTALGVTAVRTACPAVAIPAGTGDITLFDPAGRTDAGAIDVVAQITNLRSACSDSGSDVVGSATFDVVAKRTRASGARTVTLPYFSTVVRGGDVVVSKRVSSVTLEFADGQTRATARGSAAAFVDRASATVPRDIVDKIRRERKASDADADIDPMTLPDVRAAITRATFELMVGFQLTQDQLRYNVQR